jgi:hypothetical protein
MQKGIQGIRKRTTPKNGTVGYDKGQTGLLPIIPTFLMAWLVTLSNFKSKTPLTVSTGFEQSTSHKKSLPRKALNIVLKELRSSFFDT